MFPPSLEFIALGRLDVVSYSYQSASEARPPSGLCKEGTGPSSTPFTGVRLLDDVRDLLLRLSARFQISRNRSSAASASAAASYPERPRTATQTAV